MQQASPGTADDLRTIGLIGLAHGLSHFFQLVLPPLFIFMIAEFDVSYTELGAVMTVFFVTSGLAQAAAGFVVDRFGARIVLIAGLAVYCTAILLFGLLPSFWMFVPVAMLAGLGNSVFHPADFAILNATVNQSRLGRAYGVHTFGGNLGWALASAFMLLVAGVAGWRVALFAAAAIGFAVLALLIANWNRLRDESPDKPVAAASGAPATGLLPLLTTPVMLCFGYFLLLSTALIAVQNFLPATLNALHQTPLAAAGTALTGFLLGAAAGVLVGGWLADRSHRHDAVIALGLAASALLFVLIGAAALPFAPLVAAATAAGFLSGVTTPSRDMLVRSATPPGATGRVYGFVYSGLDAGSALAPVTIGLMLDHGEPRWAIWLVAAMLFAAIFTAVSIRIGAKPVAQPAE